VESRSLPKEDVGARVPPGPVVGGRIRLTLATLRRVDIPDGRHYEHLGLAAAGVAVLAVIAILVGVFALGWNLVG
jgi:hypothetical protein